MTAVTGTTPPPADGASWQRAWPARSVLAVCAHPDDESFGLGGILAALVGAGAGAAVISFTQGEASTLGAGAGALRELRAAELRQAAAALGIGRATLLGYPDGRLGTAPLDELAEHVHDLAVAVRADSLLVFDPGGITGHPDHRRATEAAMVAAERLDATVLAWTVPDTVADRLNLELATGFVGSAPADDDVVIPVDREAQRRAIVCHASQSADNPVLWRRLQLQGPYERLRYLRRPVAAPALPARPPRASQRQ